MTVAATDIPITFVSDFGKNDDFVGVCHGVIAQRSPRSAVINLTHGIEAQDINQGARVIRNTLRYTPMGVHLCVVDPGVGTARRGIAVRCVDGRYFVGPDNGLMEPAIRECGGVSAGVELNNADFHITPISPTFHGRDIFAPAAAHIAHGGDMGELGTAIEPASVVRLEIETSTVSDDTLLAPVWNIDQFGNTALSCTGSELHTFLGDGTTAEVTIRNERLFVMVGQTFADVPTGELLLYVDAYDNVSLAMNRGDVTSIFRLKVGDVLRIRPVQGIVDPLRQPATSPMNPRGR